MTSTAVPPPRVRVPLRHVGLAGAALLGAATVLLDEQVLWAGQPTGDPSAAEVSAWYADHAGSVVLGDLLWSAAAVALACILWTAVAFVRPAVRLVARVLGVAASVSLAASGVWAARLAAGVPSDVLATWHQEGAAYRVAAVLLALCLVVVMDDLAIAGRRVLLVPTPLVCVLLALPATTGYGLAAAYLLLAAIVLVLPATGRAPE